MKVVILGILIVISTSAWGQHLYHMNTTVRALGMGNSFVSVVRDANSLFYNPAGLAHTTQFNWTIMDPKLGVSGVEAVTDIMDLQDDGGLANTINALYGKNLSAYAGAKTAIVTPWFAAAYYDSFELSLLVNNPAVPEINANVVNDLGIALGFGFNVVPGVQMGMAFKRINRTGGRTLLGANLIGGLDADALQDELMRKGVGYSADLGLNFAPKIGPAESVISFVWRDMGTTSFRSSSDGGLRPPSDQDNMILGFSFLLDAGLVSVNPTFEYQMINRSDVQIGNKINFGVELGLPLIDVRAGFHQGYYTLGLGLNMGLLRFDAATYGVELGAYPGQIEDRRYLVQMTMELGFDANLNFLGGGSGGGQGGPGGNRSRLKQRR